MTPPLKRRIQLKRMVDLSLSSVALLAALPLMVVVAAAVWAGDRGRVFFSQERVGWWGCSFRMLKFRTMVMNAERATGPTWSFSGDPRVTPIGRILRATHIDELPQLWNVLRGDMSLVGPRPERAVFVQHLEQVIPGYTNRLAVRPGITGLGQLRSGYDESLRTVKRKVRYDLLYVRKGCALLDVMILLDTVLLMVGLSGGLALRKIAAYGKPTEWLFPAIRTLKGQFASIIMRS